MKILKFMTLLCCFHLLHGCASTSELYAEYDSNICPVQVASATEGKTVIRDRVTAEMMVWRPAVYFEFDQSDLLSESVARLSEDLLVLNRYTELRVAVRGFTDSLGSNSYNVDLAERRVAKVVSYFQAAGVAPDRIDEMPLGESLPLTRGDSEQAMANNRRVELLLLDSDGKALDYALEPRPAAGLSAGLSALRGSVRNALNDSGSANQTLAGPKAQGHVQEPVIGASAKPALRRTTLPAAPVQAGPNTTTGRVIQ